MGLNFHILLSHVPETIVNPTQISLSIERNFAILFKNFEQCLWNGSNWILDVLNTHYLNFSRYQPITAETYIDLPPDLKKKRGGWTFQIIENFDDPLCFTIV